MLSRLDICFFNPPVFRKWENSSGCLIVITTVLFALDLKRWACLSQIVTGYFCLLWDPGVRNHLRSFTWTSIFHCFDVCLFLFLFSWSLAEHYSGPLILLLVHLHLALSLCWVLVLLLCLERRLPWSSVSWKQLHWWAWSYC